jgi:hypothetical protein
LAPSGVISRNRRYDSTIRGEPDFFEIEPIKWRVLYKKDGEVILQTENIIN